MDGLADLLAKPYLPSGSAVDGDGDAATAGDGVWTRTFASGTRIFFNRTSAEGRVEWGPAARRFMAEHLHLQ